MDDHHTLHLPLLSSSTTTAAAAATTVTVSHHTEENTNGSLSSILGILSRFLFIIFIGAISVWANHEASKGFEIKIINDAKDSPAGRRFALFYVSNDEATRILLNASAFAENVLYYNHNLQTNQTKKQVRRIILRLAAEDMTDTAVVNVDARQNDEYIISLSPSVMEATAANNNKKNKHEIVSAIQYAMARVWLWDGQSRAPPWLLDGMAEYICRLAGVGGARRSFHGGETTESGCEAKFLGYLEQQSKGYIQRLNQALRNRWDYRTVEVHFLHHCEKGSY